MPSQRPKSPKAGTRRTSDTETLRQGSEEVAGVHRDQENSKKRQNLVKTRQTPSDRDTASQEKANGDHLRAVPFATMIREVSDRRGHRMWPETAKGTPHRDMPKKPSSRASCTEHRTPRQCTRRAHEQLSSCRALRRAIRHEGLHVLGAASCEPSITRSCPLLYKIKGGAAAARPQGQPAIGAAAAGAMRAPICSNTVEGGSAARAAS